LHHQFPNAIPAGAITFVDESFKIQLTAAVDDHERWTFKWDLQLPVMRGRRIPHSLSVLPAKPATSVYREMEANLWSLDVWQQLTCP